MNRQVNFFGMMKKQSFVRVAKSIMWLCDSKGDQSVPYSTPLATDKSLPLFKPLATGLFPNLNTVGIFIVNISIDYGAGSGTGVLAFTKSTNMLQWTAPGDSAGPPVNISTGGWFRLESNTPGKGCWTVVIIRNAPATDKSDNINYSAFPPVIGYASAPSVPAMWNLLNGNPFAENQFFFSIAGGTSSDILAAGKWNSVYTDITHIDLTTNGFYTVGSVTTIYNDIISIITLRQSIGSRVILALPNLDNLDYTVNISIPKWKSFLAEKLRVYCRANNIEYYSPAEFLNTGNSLSAPNVDANFNATAGDGVHYSQRGAYLIAKYLLGPILSKYAPKCQGLPNPLVSYDATNSPNGNLIVNSAFSTTAGTGVIIGSNISGPVPDGWTLSRGSGSVVKCTTSFVARADGKAGNNYRLALDNTGGVANEMIRMSATSVLSAGNFAVGDKVALSCEMFISGTGIAGARALIWSTAGGYLYAIDHGNNVNLGDINGETLHYNVYSMPLTIQSGFANLVPRMEFTMAANGIANFDVVPNFGLRKNL